MESGLWLLWATLAVSLLYYLTSLRSRSGNARLPPGPRPFPVVGNLLDLRGGNLHHKLACLARVHGPVMRLRLGLTTAVVISSRDAARDAFTRARGTTGVSPRERSRTPPARSDSTSGPWCGYRAPTHAGRTCAASWPRTSSPRGASRRRAASASARWETWCATSAGAPARRWISAGPCTAECSTSCPTPSAPSTWSIWALSRRCRGCARFLEDLVELIAKTNVSDLFPFLRPLDLQGCRRHAASQVAKVLRVLDGIIDRRLDEEEGEAASSNKHGDFLDALLELMSTGKITREDVMTIVFDMFVAGSDTVAITVEWAMAELLRNPSTMAKVREEIQGTLGSKESVEEHDAVSLPHLQAVVKEAMRLHAASPLFLRRATEEGVEIGGYAVPKGCTVIFLAWSIMRDPAAWERPDEFIPERFLDREEEMGFRGKEFEFIPFGAGRRQCPGLPMAERVVPLILASLLHAFEWRLPDGVSAEQLDVSEKFTTANVLAVPLRAVPVPVVIT